MKIRNDYYKVNTDLTTNIWRIIYMIVEKSQCPKIFQKNLK